MVFFRLGLRLNFSLGNQTYLCTDENILANVYKQCGRPSSKIYRENLHWWPFKLRYYELEIFNK
jgi:hypothetical protein